MIDWNDIDNRLDAIGKDRSWLVENTPYTASYIRNVLAPSAKNKTDRVQEILSKAIEDEEARIQHERELPPGVHQLWLSGEQLDLAVQACRIVNAEDLTTFCRDAVVFRVDEIIHNRIDPIEKMIRHPLPVVASHAHGASQDVTGPHAEAV